MDLEDAYEGLLPPNSEEETSFTTKAILLATIPKIPALLSVLGSSLILLYILQRRKRKRPIQAYHRIMFSMSCADWIASCCYFAGTFPIPRGTTGSFGPVFWALGTPLSCRIGGAWAQLQVLGPLYNGMLALYYLLVVRFQWTEERIKKLEPLLQFLPVFYALVTSLLGAIWDIYGSVEWLCWIDNHSDHFMAYRWIFLFAPVWICWIFVSLVMLSLYLSMRKLEQANQRYQHHNNDTNNHDKSKQIAIQGMLYVGAFYVSWLFPSIQRIKELQHKPSNFGLQMLDTSLLPLQGLLNALVYARPRFVRLQKQQPQLSRWQLLWAIHHHHQNGGTASSTTRTFDLPTTRTTTTSAMPRPSKCPITQIPSQTEDTTTHHPEDFSNEHIELSAAVPTPTPLQRRKSSAFGANNLVASSPINMGSSSKTNNLT